MFKKYRYRRKKKDARFFKLIPLFRKKLKKLQKPIIFLQLSLPGFNTTELDKKEKRNVLKIYRKLCNLGYLLDKKTISLFVVGKNTRAYPCIRTFISYYVKNNKINSEESITNVVTSQILHGIGQQYDGSLIIEMIERHVDMRILCVHAIAHFILVNICNYITYKILQKGISFIRDLSEYRIRFWNDRKLFLSTNIIHSIFPVVMVVLVDPPFQMNAIFRSLLRKTSKNLARILYTVKRPLAQRNRFFQQILWNDIEWVGKRLPELHKKFPYMRLSKIFGGTDGHLLEMVSAAKCFVTTICLKCEGDLNFAESSSDEISTVLPIGLSNLEEDKNCFTSSSNEEIDKNDFI